MLQWQIGEVSVTSVTEMDDGAIPGTAVIPEATADAVLAVDWLRPRFADDTGNIRLRIQALVVESLGRRIVVDTCLGNDKPRTNPFFDSLHVAVPRRPHGRGFPAPHDRRGRVHPPAVDHVGWNTDAPRRSLGADVSRTRADYLSRVDVEHWSTTPSADGDLFGDSVRPVLDRVRPTSSIRRSRSPAR